MKRFYLFVQCCLLSIVAISQGWELSFPKGEGATANYRVFATEDGGCFMFLNLSNSTIKPFQKYDENGELEWESSVEGIWGGVRIDQKRDEILFGGNSRWNENKFILYRLDLQGTLMDSILLDRFLDVNYIQLSHFDGFYIHYDETYDYRKYQKFNAEGVPQRDIQENNFHYSTATSLFAIQEAYDGRILYGKYFSADNYRGFYIGDLHLDEKTTELKYLSGRGIQVRARGFSSYFFLQQYRDSTVVGTLNEYGFLTERVLVPLDPFSPLDYRLLSGTRNNFAAIEVINPSPSNPLRSLGFLNFSQSGKKQRFFCNEVLPLEQYEFGDNDILKPDYSIDDKGNIFVIGTAKGGQEILLTKIGRWSDRIQNASKIKEDIRIYPNPAITEVYIRILSDQHYEKYLVRIIGEDGRLIDSRAFEDWQIKIDLGSSDPGAYFIQVFGDGKQIASRQLVVSP